MATSQIINVTLHGSGGAPPQMAPSFTSSPASIVSNTGTTAQGSVLTVNFTAAGQPFPTASFQWKSNSVNVGTNALTYTAAVSDIGNNITCTITLNNGVSPNAIATTPNFGPITTPNVAPSFTVSPTVTGSVVQGQTLTVGYTGAGNPAPNPAYQWKSAGVNVGTNQNTYVTQAGDLGNLIACVVTLSNGVGTPASASSPNVGPVTPIVIVNGVPPFFNPQGQALPMSGSLVVGSTLTVTYAAGGTPSPTVTFVWKSNGTTVGTSANTYTTQNSDIGNNIVATATASNGVPPDVSTNSYSSGPIVGTGGGTAPTFSVSPNVTGSLVQGQTLTVGYTGVGNPPPTATFQWLKNGVNISGQTTSQYATVSGDVGANISCTVTLANGVSPNAVVTSATVGPITGASNAPLFTSGPTIGGSIVQGQQLSVTYTASGSPTPTAAYQWKSNGTNVGTNSLNYTTVLGDVGHTITCQVTLSNGVSPNAVVTTGATAAIQPIGSAVNPTTAVLTLTDNTLAKNVTVYTFDAANGVDLGNYTDPNGRFVMTNKRIKISGCPIFVDYRTIPAQNWACFVFWYSNFPEITAPYTYQNLRAYTANMGGTVVNLPGHWAQSRWRQCFRNGVADTAQNCWPFSLTNNPATLAAAKLVPPMSASVVNGTAQDLGTATFIPMDISNPVYLCGLERFQPDQGGRPDIGPVTGWQGQFLAGGPNQAGSLQAILAQGESGATYPMFYVDPATNAIADCILTYPKANEYGGNGFPQMSNGPGTGTFQVTVTGPPGSVFHGMDEGFDNSPRFTITSGRDAAWRGPNTIPAGGSITIFAHNAGGLESYDPGNSPVTLTQSQGDPVNNPTGPSSFPGLTFVTVPNSFIPGSMIDLDDAHFPPVAWVPWLFTGDPYYLETQQAMAMHAYTEQPMWDYGIPGASLPGINQMRQLAWNLRSIFQAATGTPGSAPSWLVPKSTFTTALENFRLAVEVIRAQTSSPVQTTFHTIYNPGADHMDSWQGDYFALIVCWISTLYPAWIPTREWLLDNVIQRISGNGTTGWCGGDPSYYSADLRGATTWAQLWANNVGTWAEWGGPVACAPNIAAGMSDGHTNPDYIATMMMLLKVARWAGNTTTAGVLATAEPQVISKTFPGGPGAYGWQQAFS